jgi:hypothetical protein
MMLDTPRLRRRGGYDDEAFRARLEPTAVFDERPPGDFARLTLYRIRPAATTATMTTR